MKVTFPAWHDDARRLRDQGMPIGQIAMILRDAGINVSESRISQVTNKNWEDYAERDIVRAQAAKAETEAAKREGRLPDLKTAMKAAVADWWKEKQAMSDRKFEMVTSHDPSDTGHRVRINCSHSGCDKSLIFVRRGIINPTHAAKWFRDKGWFVSSDPRKDLCDDHNLTKSNHKRADGGADIIMKHENINNGAVKAAIAAVIAQTEPPQPERYAQDRLPQREALSVSSDPEKTLEEMYPDNFNRGPPPPPVYHNVDTSTDKIMSRADKRIIFNKLEEVYVDEFIGYRTGWSDSKVSIDLGCPRVWVVAVRDENFGPEITVAMKKVELIRLGEEIDAKVVELKNEIIPGIAITITEYDKMVDQIDAKLARYEEMQNAITANLLAFNTKLKELKDD